LSKLDGPHYLDGYLPIVQLRCDQDGENYGQEVFTSVDPALAASGAILVKIDLPDANRGRIELRFENGYDLFKVDAQHLVRDSAGTPLAQLDDNWEFAPARSSFTNKEQHARSMVLMIFTAAPAGPATRAAGPGMQPEMEAAARAWASTNPSPVNLDFYEHQRELSIRRWSEILASGTQVSVPEPIVNNAWRTLVVAEY